MLQVQYTGDSPNLTMLVKHGQFLPLVAKLLKNNKPSSKSKHYEIKEKDEKKRTKREIHENRTVEGNVINNIRDRLTEH